MSHRTEQFMIEEIAELLEEETDVDDPEDLAEKILGRMEVAAPVVNYKAQLAEELEDNE